MTGWGGDSPAQCSYPRPEAPGRFEFHHSLPNSWAPVSLGLGQLLSSCPISTTWKPRAVRGLAHLAGAHIHNLGAACDVTQLLHQLKEGTKVSWPLVLDSWGHPHPHHKGGGGCRQ